MLTTNDPVKLKYLIKKQNKGDMLNNPSRNS